MSVKDFFNNNVLEIVAQSAHFFSSVAIMYVGTFSKLHWNPVYICIWIFFASGIKEAVIDPLVETKATQGSGWLDFGVQAGGALLALALIKVA